jgi:type VI secretion system protein ImpK
MHDSATVGGATFPAGSSGRRGHLAMACQEALTAVARLRTDRQVAADAEAFRSHLKRLLGQADGSARDAGYPADTVRLAVYAVVALVDESVLASSHPIFADWPRRPLQEEVFGEHMAGAVFFDNLRSLLGQQDSEELADLLEVYLLCLLLGFQGRYAGGDGAQLAAIKTAVSDKIIRIRGVSGELTPDWGPPAGERVPPSRDPWTRRLLIVAGATWVLVLLLWILYFVILRSAG